MEKIKILLVDDEQEFIQSLAERLQIRNIHSGLAFDGFEALERVQADCPDLMVLDLRMPGMDGMDVLRQIKKTHPQVEVIILTGHGSDLDQEQAMRLGAFAYLRKPAEIDILVDTLKKAAARRELMTAVNDS